MASKGTVKDKVYYISEVLNLPKSWIPEILDVSSTTLTKWTYNPRNVSEEMSERIFLRLAILEQMNLQTRMTAMANLFVPPKGFQDYWAVAVNGDVYYIKDKRRHLPGSPPDALVNLVRNAIVREEHQHPLYVRHRYDRRNGQLSKIAKDTSLELPLGIFRWDKERV